MNFNRYFILSRLTRDFFRLVLDGSVLSVHVLTQVREMDVPRWMVCVLSGGHGSPTPSSS